MKLLMSMFFSKRCRVEKVYKIPKLGKKIPYHQLASSS